MGELHKNKLPQIIEQNNCEYFTAKYLYNLISEKLPGQKVLLLLAGGSAVKIYPLLVNLLKKITRLQNLTVSLGDERWNKDPAHAAANWPQIRDTGFPELLESHGGAFYRILKGKTLKEDTLSFNKFLKGQLKHNPFIVSIQGIGADGHTAGIFPSGQELFGQIMGNKNLAYSHHMGPAGQEERISITPRFIGRINELILFAKGVDKLPVLETVVKLWESPISSLLKQQQIRQYPVLLAFKQNCTLITDQKIAY